MAANGRRGALVLALVVGPSLPGMARAQSSPEPSEVPGSVLVHIESPAQVDLQRATGNRRDPFYVACTSPCDEWVPARGPYRIAGNGTRASNRFDLRASGGRETIIVSPASSTAFGIGIVAIAVGGVALGLAFLEAWVGAMADGPSSPGDTSSRRDLVLGLFGGGLLAEAGGAMLMVVNASSRVRQTTGFGLSGRPLLFPPDVVGHPTVRLAGGVPGVLPLLRLAF